MQTEINLHNYPINQPSEKLDLIINKARSDLETDGCAILRGFLSNIGVKELIKEADAAAKKAHHSSRLHQNGKKIGAFTHYQQKNQLNGSG